MSADPIRLDDLLESVADGTSVDWDAIEAEVAPQERRLLRHLRVVAGIAEVHRTLPFDEPAASTVPSAVPTADRENRWGELLLIEKVAEGSFGEVYRARDPWLDREVALKLLKPGVASRIPGTRIVEEARQLARVRHPNVVTVHGADVHDGRVGLWMEFINGRTLAQIVAAEGPFSAGEAAMAGLEICRALSAVHAAGLVHHDVKPQNVVREAGGRLVLMDFSAGHTPLYLAPEVLQTHEATVRSDIYALGVLLFYLVTRSHPVNGSTVADLDEAHASGERRRLADVRPDLPQNFVAVVERATDPDPAGRFPTAAQMQAALASVAGLPSTTPAAPPESKRPARVWRLPTAAVLILTLSAGAAYWRYVRPESDVAHAAVQMIAVLPLQPLGGAERYVADSLTEALMQELSTAGPIMVVSRTSVNRLYTDNVPLPELASRLGADAVVEGSVFRSGDRVEVNIRVIHAGTDAAVWAQTFERVAADLSLIQRDVARAMATELRLALHPGTLERWQNAQAINKDALDEYQRGRDQFRQQTQGSVEQALKHFQRAVAIEPRYARAHVGIAECYLMLGNEFRVVPLPEGARRARSAVERALQLDARLADARSVLGDVSFEYDWNFKAAEEHFRRAIELDPSLVTPRENYAAYLVSRARFAEAFDHLAVAQKLDPLSSVLADRTAAAYYYARQFDKALAEAERAIELDPKDISGHVGRGRILNAMGRHQEAIAQYQRTAREFFDHPFFAGEIAQAESALKMDARPRIRALEKEMSASPSRVSAQTLALAYARVDRDMAFTWLERAFAERAGAVLWLKVDPRVDPLRTDPRFNGYLKRLELEP